MRYLFVFLFAVSFLYGSELDDYEAEKRVDQLLLIMQKRLSFMHEVAKVKWNKALPIEDKARENEILDSISHKSNVNPWILRFFKAQMEAAKELQRFDFTCWQNAGMKSIETDLKLDSELRAYIDRLNEEILSLIQKVKEADFYKYRLNKPISIRESDSIPSAIWNKAILSLSMRPLKKAHLVYL
ncbi:MAG: chorismate mutase [Parachlamydiaceae bacterium]